MRKFTAFTVILTVVVVVVGAELVVNEYLPKVRTKNVTADDLDVNLPESLDLSKVIETSLFGAGGTGTIEGVSEEPGRVLGTSGNGGDEALVDGDEIFDAEVLEDVVGSEVLGSDLEYEEFSEEGAGSSNFVRSGSVSGADDALDDFENEEFVGAPKSVALRQEQIDSAGFVGAYIEKEPHNGLLYKTVYVDDLFDVRVVKNLIRSEDSLLARVYVFELGPNADAGDVFDVLKVRAAEGLEVEINETDDFAQGSFYMNDLRRPSTAFLTVRVGKMLYGFSYPKDHHLQVKNLVKLLDWEF